VHEVGVNSKAFNKELEKIMGKSSKELYDKKSLLLKNSKKSNKRAQKRKDIKKILHPFSKTIITEKEETKMEVENISQSIDYSMNEVIAEKLKIKVPEDSISKYRIIGFVVNGNYSLLKGYGHGIGYILNQPPNKIQAFIRNPNGRLYYPCILKRINMEYKL